MKLHAPTNQLGFTLIEIFMVVLITAILATVAVPAMSSVIRNQAISATSNEIIATLQVARSEAVKRSTEVAVCFKNAANDSDCKDTTTLTNHYIYVFLDTNRNQARDTAEEILYQSNELNKNISYAHPSGTINSVDYAGLKVTNSIRFNSKGGVVFDNDSNQRRGLIGICDGRSDNKYGRVVEVNNTGRAQVTKITANSGIDCT